MQRVHPLATTPLRVATSGGQSKRTQDAFSPRSRWQKKLNRALEQFALPSIKTIPTTSVEEVR